MKKIILDFLLIFLPLLVTGQSSGYIQYTMEDGLPSNRVYGIYEDKTGYVWISTSNGLSRFDGERFTNYGIKDSLPDTEVFRVFEDFHGRLWINTFRQKVAFLFEGRLYNETVVPAIKKIPLNYIIWDFIPGRDSSLLLTSGHITHITSQKFDELTVKTFDQFKFRAVKKVRDQVLGFDNIGIHQITLSGDSMNIRSVFDFGANSIFHRVTTNDDFLVVTLRGHTYVLQSDGTRIQFIQSAPKEFEVSYLDDTNHLWGSVPGEGVYRYHLDERGLHDPVLYLSGKKISEIYKDHLGNMWFGSFHEGLFSIPKVHAQNWNQKQGLRSENIVSLTSDPKGQLLLGDDSGFLYRMQGDQISLLDSYSKIKGLNQVRQIIAGQDSSIYTLTDEGCYYYRQGKRKRLHTGACKSMVTINDDHIYLGTSVRLLRINKHNNQVERILNERVTVLEVDQEGYFWLGTSIGLFSSADQFTKNWGTEFTDLRFRIVDMISDRNLLWLVNSENDIIKIKIHKGQIKQVERYFSRQLSHIGIIKKIQLSEGGILWLVTNQGVYASYPSGQTKHYGTAHGLRSNEINDVLLQGDSLWVATVNGLSRIILQEDRGAESPKTELVALEYQDQKSAVAVSLMGEKARRGLRVRSRSLQVKAQFSSLQCYPCETYSYQHIIKRYRNVFPNITFKDVINFFTPSIDTIVQTSSELNFGFNVAAGRYVIESKANNLTQQSEVQAVHWEMTILPLWRNTIWPYLGFLALVILFAIRYYRIHTQRLKLENDFVKSKLSALGNQINPHFIGNTINAVKQFFYPPQLEKASDYIHLFTDLLRKTLKVSETDFIPLSKEIDYIQKYLDLIQLRYHERFEYQILLDDQLSREAPFPTMLLQPILENATIHGLAERGPSKLIIHFYRRGNQLVCTVEDNGIGIIESARRKQQKQPLSNRKSMGRQLLKNKVDMLNQLYKINLNIQWIDLSTIDQELHGTRVLLRYHINQLTIQK